MLVVNVGAALLPKASIIAHHALALGLINLFL
jgi:hypothetical protein